MAAFDYSAQSKDGKLIEGTIDASSRDAATSAIMRQGMKPISVKEHSKKSLKNIKIGGNKVKSTDIVIFTRQLSTMVSAGVPLLRALTALSQQSESDTLKEALEAVVKDVQAGTQLADALEKHPKIFSDIYINMVRAGEAGGILDDILKRLAIQQEKTTLSKRK